MSDLLSRFDQWLSDEGPAAVVLREYLEPAGGPDAVLFPPTFAPPEQEKNRPSGYIVDEYNGTKTCLIDSVGSQANRIEPVFKAAPYNELVPQVSIQAGERTLSLLDLGHRAADAVARFSSLSADLRGSFQAYASGDAEPLAKIAPTSLVFGAWDSRETQVKLPRLVESVIRAFDIVQLNRGAQFVAALRPEEHGLAADVSSDDLSTHGLADAPSRAPGGIVARGGIRRDALINLTALRCLHASTHARTVALRRYILGLALVSLHAGLTAAANNLRQGCLLVRDAAKQPEATLVTASGIREPFEVTREEALEFARAAAAAFGVGESRIGEFTAERAKAAIGKAQEKKAGKKKEAAVGKG